ncbi:hypothetical protein ACTHQ4_10300 [Alkalicoccobacillus gibsonii]|uniref:hypothetical protein n=1 Tax=Alkalicoccobacillus gibsonii TaxID=79881 RepID=UPI003F7BF193
MKRIEALHEISRITDDYCSECPFNDQSKVEQCLGCDHYLRLRNIGNALVNQTSEKRKGKGVESVEVIRGHKPKRPCTLTVNEYKELKQKGLTDMEVAKANDCSWKQLRHFKVRENLVRQ